MFKSQINFKIPDVYRFHKVSAKRFEPLAKYLSGHRYETLSSDEFYDLYKSPQPLINKSLLLTFDDGDSCLWTQVFPLLKKYGLKATVFVLPQWMNDRQYPRPNINDYWSGRTTLADIQEAEAKDSYISWQEAYQMHKSGVVDIQSHTLNHNRCWVGSEIIDFQHPVGSNEPGYTYLFTAIDGNANMNLWGCPIYRNESRMVARRYFDDSRLSNTRIEYVSQNGGLSFFKQPSWKRQLYQLVTDYKSKNILKGYFETESKQEEAIRYSLTKSKQLIESKLVKKCTSVAFPWGQANLTTISYARQAGYLMSFFGETLPFSKEGIQVEDVKSHFLITRLPGLLDYPFIRDKFYKPKRLFSLLRKTIFCQR